MYNGHFTVAAVPKAVNQEYYARLTQLQPLIQKNHELTAGHNYLYQETYRLSAKVNTLEAKERDRTARENSSWWSRSTRHSEETQQCEKPGEGVHQGQLRNGPFLLAKVTDETGKFDVAVLESTELVDDHVAKIHAQRKGITFMVFDKEGNVGQSHLPGFKKDEWGRNLHLAMLRELYYGSKVRDCQQQGRFQNLEASFSELQTLVYELKEQISTLRRQTRGGNGLAADSSAPVSTINADPGAAEGTSLAERKDLSAAEAKLRLLAQEAVDQFAAAYCGSQHALIQDLESLKVEVQEQRTSLEQALYKLTQVSHAPNFSAGAGSPVNHRSAEHESLLKTSWANAEQLRTHTDQLRKLKDQLDVLEQKADSQKMVSDSDTRDTEKLGMRVESLTDGLAASLKDMSGLRTELDLLKGRVAVSFTQFAEVEQTCKKVSNELVERSFSELSARLEELRRELQEKQPGLQPEDRDALSTTRLEIDELKQKHKNLGLLVNREMQEVKGALKELRERHAVTEPLSAHAGVGAAANVRIEVATAPVVPPPLPAVEPPPLAREPEPVFARELPSPSVEAPAPAPEERQPAVLVAPSPAGGRMHSSPHDAEREAPSVRPPAVPALNVSRARSSPAPPSAPMTDQVGQQAEPAQSARGDGAQADVFANLLPTDEAARAICLSTIQEIKAMMSAGKTLRDIDKHLKIASHPDKLQLKYPELSDGSAAAVFTFVQEPNVQKWMQTTLRALGGAA